MRKISLSKIRFVQSALTEDSMPKWRLPEVALCGKSNVGKSSLINHFFNRKGLAKVSATPGKTQTLNFFEIEDELAFVDLPGYGFARVPKHLKDAWSKNLNDYLETRKNLRLLLVLIDSRRTPAEEDLALIHWAQHHGKSLVVIYTKCDQVKTLPPPIEGVPCIYYSIKSGSGRDHLLKILGKLWD